jgi:methylglutaconyl-CoA hydratase
VSSQAISLEREGPIVRLWLDRPERRNALDGRTLEEIARVFSSFAADFGVGAVVRGGRGPPCGAGADR